MSKIVSAAIIIIGNEVLSGRTQDSNIRFLAKGLHDVGIRLREVRIIADLETAIIDAIHHLRDRYDYVFTTGGIGPTHDDITSESIAKAFNVPLILDPRAVACLKDYIPPEDLNEARLRMARIPEGADLIDNPVSRAPGFKIGNVYVMAGVPKIMQAMFEGLKPSLIGGQKILTKSITIYCKEGTIASELSDIQKDFKDDDIGSYPFFDSKNYGTVIVTRSINQSHLDQIGLRLFSLAQTYHANVLEGDHSPSHLE
jgi:molybdenum cofactor synthesis domain-containing protein